MHKPVTVEKPPFRYQLLGAVTVFAIFTLAAIVLHHELRTISLHTVRQEIAGLSSGQIGAAIALTIASYGLLTIYDVLGLRYVGKKVAFPRVALASFTSYTFAHNLGVAAVTGGSMRYRVYSGAGLSMLEVAALVVVCGTTFFLGGLSFAGIGLLLHPALFADPLRLPDDIAVILGVACLGAVSTYLALTAFGRREINVMQWRLQLPSLSIGIGQLMLAMCDVAIAAGVLYALLPHDANVSFLLFAEAYAVAIMLGTLSHVPGGLGVFETVMLTVMPGVAREQMVAALVVYRIVYYLMPLGFALLLVLVDELAQRRKRIGSGLELVRAVIGPVAPIITGGGVFVTGLALLLSGATPAEADRMAALSKLVPLFLIEASHVASSAIGVALIALAYGLSRRVRVAANLTGVLLVAGIAASLLKGWDYEEALLLAGVLAILLLGRPAFYRNASITADPPSRAWLLVLLACGIVYTVVGLFAYRHTPYSHDLWLAVSIEGDAPRFLRASLAIALVIAGTAALRLIKPASSATGEATGITDAIAGIVAASPEAGAHLALTGDKRFLVGENGDAFIMYQASGGSWITMGDPVGPVDAWPDLLWRFRELADRHGARPVFYEVGGEHAALYLDLGMTLHKLGDEAIIDLDRFELEGRAAKDLRHSLRALDKAGCTVEIVAARDVPELIGELKSVSDAWLGERGTEKRFSVGAFRADYLCRCDIAVIRKDGRIVAFANLWRGAEKHELSVDLMRATPEAPKGAMKGLLAWTCLYAKAEGYQRFNLGMAPLSGMQVHRLAPRWHKLARFAFAHGDRFYSFGGLRAFKDEFTPDWRPRYIAVRGALALPQALLDAARLIGI